MKKDEEQTYQTADLYLAAFLYTSKIELADLQREGSKGIFVFGDGAKCRELTLAFYRGKGTCDAREYARAVQELKSVVHNL